ncbi:uncharacterized protein BDZ83DRAFT_382926 [Colletotrichum acutatum]|uniref:Uncharacterized protein n=1 Tax=Glomerella acutata TaxID=27357 RepID=A0AAD8UL41_GLOAC|nr:uncharacterized protein BDZ83DRAFT_382926 [Colletotrichum acutatum]KAK1723724.1 hypothetical protein BDZ83DRAFT_382926 [Colletotrichum acutatum]
MLMQLSLDCPSPQSRRPRRQSTSSSPWANDWPTVVLPHEHVLSFHVQPPPPRHFWRANQRHGRISKRRQRQWGRSAPHTAAARRQHIPLHPLSPHILQRSCPQKPAILRTKYDVLS